MDQFTVKLQARKKLVQDETDEIVKNNNGILTIV